MVRPLLDWPPQESLVVGLYASWGAGKTSVLNLLQALLASGETKDRAIVVRFNPWLYSDSETLLQSFFKTLQKATRSTPLLTASRKKSLATALDSISKFVVPVAGVLSRPLTGGQDFVTPVSAGIKTAVSAALDGGEPRYEAQKRKAAAVLEKLGTRKNSARLIVLIDDLDRAEASEVLAMLKLVRLIADLPNITYVLAMDFQRVTNLLLREQSIDQAYLEKIVQIPVTLPPISDARLRTLLIAGIEQVLKEASSNVLAEEMLYERGVDVDHLLLWRVRTLRDRARLLNSYRFLLLSSGTTLEVNPGDALLISFLRTFDPGLLDRVRRNRDFLLGAETYRDLSLFIKDDKARKVARSVAFSSLVSGRQTSVDTVEAEDIDLGWASIGSNTALSQSEARLRSIISFLFPYAESGFTANESTAAEWRRQNRIAVEERFDRYFDYTNPPNSVSDAQVEDWMVAAKAVLGVAQAVGALQIWRETANTLLPENGPIRKGDDFVSKVLDRVGEFEVTTIPALAHVFAYSVETGAVAAADAGRLIRRLVYHVRHERLSFQQSDHADEPYTTIEVQLHGAFSIAIAWEEPFDAVIAANEYISLGQRDGDTSVRDDVASALDAVADAGIGRMRSAVARGVNVFSVEGPRAGRVIWRWRDLLRRTSGDYAEIRRYLSQMIDEDPRQIADILGLFAGWTGRDATLTAMSLNEVRSSAKQIIGWGTLLRGVVRYLRMPRNTNAKRHLLVRELQRMLRSEANERARAKRLQQIAEDESD